MRSDFRGRLATLSVLIAVMHSGPGHAHHGFTNHFIPDEERTIEGTVTKFEFTNPHVKIHVQVQNEDGATESWIAETGGSSGYLRNGRMSSDSLQAGDHIQIVGHPARANAHEIRANYIKLPNGDELNMNNPYISIPFLEKTEGTEQN
jgi:hypothetical protein